MSFFVLWNLNEHKPTTCSECISYVDCVEHYSTAWGVKTMSEKDIKPREGEKASCLVTEAEGEEGEKR